VNRRALAAAAAALALGSCRHTPPAGAPPVPLSSPEPHVEPDLVGVIHVVKRGETLTRIAKAYGVPVRELQEVNDLRDARALEPGKELFIPGAARSREVPAAVAGAPPEPDVAEPEAAPDGAERAKAASLRWPVQGVLYSRFGVRQGQRHDGIDIAAPEGTTVGAAAAGAVVYAGEQSGYGSIVILRHDDGLLTLYAHASAILVRHGDRVEAGQPIARVGRSGRTSGPHLHFEVRDGTRPRNPLFYLP
jgi:lipoprotein NlpD